MNYTSRKPLVPEDRTRTRISQPIFRAAVAALLSEITSWRIDLVVKNHYPNDEGTALVTRAAVTGATTTTIGWAQEIVSHGFADFISVLAGSSAASTLMLRGQQFTYDGAYTALQVPSFTATSASSSFLSQGANVPVHKFDFGKYVYLPVKKLVTITSYTRELFQHSVPNIEAAVRATILESMGLTLDSIMFDATTADVTRPAGLLAGISATPASANSDHNQAMLEDVTALGASVSAVASNGAIVFIASPKQAIALRLRAPHSFPYEVLSSAALADGVVVCIAANCLVSAADPAPRFWVTNEASIISDDAPTDIVAAGGQPFSGGAVKSFFQVDALGLRTIWQVNFGLRSATGLAWTQSVLW